MGNAPGRLPGERLSKKEIERLQRRFQRLADSKGRVSITKLTGLPEVGANPFVGRIFEIFDTDGNGHLGVKEFTKALEYFGSIGEDDEQYRFAFRIYDIDNDGLISGTELFRTLQVMLGQTYPEAQLEQVVHNTLLEYDADGDGSLNFEEFKMLVGGKDLANKFSLQL